MQNVKHEQRTDAFTRGSQIYMHRFRMMIQGTKVCSLVGIFSCTIWFFIQFWKKTTFLSVYYWLWSCYANFFVIVSNLFYSGQKINITFFNWTKKKMQQMYAQDFLYLFWHKPYGKILKQFAKWLIQDAIFETLVAFSIGFFVAIVFFSLQGKKDKTKTKLRGGAIVSSKELTTMLKKTKMASKIRFNSMPIPQNSEKQHILVTGTTGSGKTNFFNELLPQVRAMGGKAIIVDITGSFVTQFFDPSRDILLNPFDARSANWLPWADCFEEYDYAAMASAIIGEGFSDDSFWDKSAQAVIQEGLRKTAEMQKIGDFLDILTSTPLKEYGEFFKNTSAAAFTDPQGDRTTLSIRATLSSKIEPLKYLCETRNPFSITKYILDQKQEGWLFITATPDQRSAISPLISVWFNIAIKGAMKRDPDVKNQGLWAFADELAAIGKIPSLKTGLAEGRKYGLSIVAGTQNIHQLNSIYGSSEAKNLLDQFGNRFVFRMSDGETAKMLANTLGEVETVDTNESLSFGAHAMRDGVNINHVEKKSLLVMPTELMALENLSCFVRFAGKWPITKLKMSYQKPIVSQRAFVLKERKKEEEFEEIEV